MFGFASDLERTDVLYTSLLVQMWHGLAAAQVPALEPEPAGLAAQLAARLRHRGGRPGPRRRAATATCQADRPGRPGSASRTALVLADRVAGHPRQHRAGLPASPARPGSPTAAAATATGYAQGQRADIGTARLRGASRALTG